MNKNNNNSICYKLKKFMEEHRIKKDENKVQTHISLGGLTIGKFSITELADIKTFHKLYAKAVKNIKEDIEIDDNNYLGFAETPLDQGPIIIDIDLKYSIGCNSESRIYVYQDIISLLELYNSAILKFINVDNDDFKAYVFEKKIPTIEKEDGDKITYKDGFHIMYPRIVASVMTQLLIREIVLINMKQQKIFEHLSLDNCYEDVLDKNVIGKNNWLMYGSCKKGNSNSVYQLTKKLNFDNEIDSEIDDSLELLIQELSIRQYTNSEITKYQEEYDDNKIKELYEKILNSRNKKHRNRDNLSQIDINRCRKLVNLLNKQRADRYLDWINVGLCLFNIDNDLLDEWIEFSKLSSKFKNGECEKTWNTFKKKEDGLNIGSLYRWAKSDNIEGFIKLLTKEHDHEITKSIYGPTSGNIAAVFHKLYKYNYVCKNPDKKSLYEFKEHRWKELEGASSIKHLLQNEFSEFYWKLANDYREASKSVQDSDEKEKLFKKYEIANKISVRLTSHSFKKEVLSELYDYYYDEEFKTKLNENKDLICFKNGVLDLSNLEFREGRPEDYISFCTNINYIPYDRNNEKIIQVEKFFSDIQPNENIKKYLLKFLASCLDGHQKDQLFLIWTGTGANGKGRIIKLHEETLGDYSKSMSENFLTQKRGNSSSANPEIAGLKGIRFISIQEPENPSKIHSGIFKTLVGGDKISGRGLFQDIIEFYLQCKPVLACNDLPPMTSFDGGVKRRTRVMSFDYKFVKTPNPNNPYQKKSNENIDQDIKTWKEAYMSLLVEIYKLYKYEGIDPTPSEVTKHTEQYQNDSDLFTEWLNNNIVRTNDEEEYLTITQIYDNYKDWIRTEGRLNEKITKNKFKNELNNNDMKPRNNKYYGIKIKDCEEPTESENRLNNSIPTIEANDFRKKLNNNDSMNSLNILMNDKTNDSSTIKIQDEITQNDLLDYDEIFIKPKSALKTKKKKSSIDALDNYL